MDRIFFDSIHFKHITQFYGPKGEVLAKCHNTETEVIAGHLFCARIPANLLGLSQFSAQNQSSNS